MTYRDWPEWVLSWAQLFKGAFALEVGPKCLRGEALPFLLPHCQLVEQSWPCERYKKSKWVDFQALASLNHFRAHSRESVALGPLGRVCR